ncbi:unnamed protein product [Lymnaea stagnalis]|uniref:ZP domain-containing protein n=1 Tax=Lymnaea stagnalis TaxID=6523 RepID=A0AAV2H6D0_LYMST
MASAFKQGRFTACIFLFWLMTIIFCTQKEAEASDPILKYDCRKPGEICVSSQNCNLTTGSCGCQQNTNNTHYDYSCQSYSINALANCLAFDNCSGHGFCNATNNCVCDEGYYGGKCSMPRVQVACNLTHMFINVNPYGSGGMFVYVSGHQEAPCVLQDKVPADLRNFGLAGDVKGWNLVISHNGSTCGGAIVKHSRNQPGTKIYKRTFQMQYLQEIKTLEDKVIEAECKISGNEEVISFGNYTVNDISKDNGLNVSFAITANVTLAVQHNGTDVSSSSINLGDELDLIFTMSSVNNVYNDFMIKECTANDVDNSSTSVRLIYNLCPNLTLSSLFMIPPPPQGLKSNHTKNSSPSNPAVTLKLKAFMFTEHGQSARISFTCTVTFCNEECTQHILDVTQSANTAGRKRRSADNEAKVSAVVTVVDPFANVKELKNTNQMEQCLQEPSFIATLATCGAVIFILLIICIILATKLMTLRQKRVNEPTGCTGPAFELRIPRLSVSNSKEHFYHHD